MRILNAYFMEPQLMLWSIHKKRRNSAVGAWGVDGRGGGGRHDDAACQRCHAFEALKVLMPFSYLMTAVGGPCRRGALAPGL